MIFVPYGMQISKKGVLWCYIQDAHYENTSLGNNPGVFYISDSAKYHAEDTISLAGYRWTIVRCVQLRSPTFKRVEVDNGVPTW